jgi:hypothetical protein
MWPPVERRDGDHRDWRTGVEEVDRLDETGVVKSAALVNGDEDRRLLPLLLVTLGEKDDVFGKRLEQIELRTRGMAVHRAIGLDVGDGRQRARSSDRKRDR